MRKGFYMDMRNKFEKWLKTWGVSDVVEFATLMVLCALFILIMFVVIIMTGVVVHYGF